MSKNTTFLFLIVFTAMTACKDDPCFKGTGDRITERRDLPGHITYVSIADNLHLHLFIDTVNYVEVTAGSHLVPFIKTETDGRSLVISNSNSCSFLRNFDQDLTINLHIKENLSEIAYEASGDLIMHDTLKTNHFEYISHTGGGKVVLFIKADFAKIFVAGGFSETTVFGSTLTARLLNAGSSWFYAQHFPAIYGDLENRGSGDLYVTMTDSIHSKITGAGNIRYYGSPRITIISNQGRGHILPAAF